ncbi:RibD family protein [Prochlorococcus marinus]|uniref:Pyrimidine reductase n=1 Tax=Prochlorococcus marinus XMU1408 TaxID=2213228 RepID=A0A318R1X9_PROMR|nr:RibD family protein [Prochlorococcus marinus]MBW3041168.1 pyrimidine reductase [Prochlorococcus marinus str. XMU1408]PYE03766.1 pyrimidine reductase [Prochlorococcus marinus XMU1408]
MKKKWVRLVLASSIDGRIAYPEGGKTQLGQSGDRLVLEESLAWSDGILMGGQTLRDHQSICVIKNKNLLKQRTLEGKNAQPIALIASNQIDFPATWPFFKQPLQRWLIQKQEKKNESLLHNGFDKKINLKFTWRDSLDVLYQKGIAKIVLLGGANLISNFLLEDLIDELQITITPNLLGGDYCWVSSELRNLNTIMNKKNNWILKESRKLGNNELLIRYFRNNLSKI